MTKYGYSDASFNDVTPDFVQEFDYYLRGEPVLDTQHHLAVFDGNQWIIIRRIKTATSSNVMLLDIPKMINEKYAGLSKDGKLFPVPSNTVCDDSLKRMSQLIDCLKEKKVTFHLVRHTFANLFLNEGVPLESLSKMLGR